MLVGPNKLLNIQTPYNPILNLYDFDKEKNIIFEQQFKEYNNNINITIKQIEDLNSNFINSTRFYRQCIFLVCIEFYIILTSLALIKFLITNNQAQVISK